MDEAGILDLPGTVMIEGKQCSSRELVSHMRNRTAHGLHMLAHLRSNVELPDPEFIDYLEGIIAEKGRLELQGLSIHRMSYTPREIIQEIRCGTPLGEEMLATLRTMHAKGEL